jgi:AraC-like DNA-binding protein
MNRKNKSWQKNGSPIPVDIEEEVCASGMWICSIFENAITEARKPNYKRRFDYYVIVHLLDGLGFYWNPRMKKEVVLNPGEGLMITPADIFDYGGYDNVFVEDSIAFAGPLADSLFKANVFKDGIIHFGKGRKLLPIIEKQRETTVAAQLEANAMLQQLLFEINNNQQSKDEGSDHQFIVQSLLKEIRRDFSKWWTVSQLAELCDVSENHFRKIFKEAVGLSPKKFLENIKLQHAKELLVHSNDSIKDIAEQLGYKESYHFMNRFKLQMGLSPGKFRKSYDTHHE